MLNISMSTLASMYDDFAVPALKVKVAGSDVIGSSDYAVESVEVVLSQEAASAAVIRLTGVYDLEKRSFISDVSSDFILGELIEVEMGYGSKLESLFYGYVDEINYDLSESPSVTVTAVDFRRIMMASNRSNVSHNATSYSDAFQSIIKEYKAAYKSVSVDATEKLEDTECIIQNGSDYEFIKDELCKKGNRIFYTHAGDVYFKKSAEDLCATVEMEWSKDLISFQRRASFQDVVIRILGQNTDKKEEVEVEVSVKSDDKQKSLVKSEKTEMNADLDSQNEAKKVADHKADEEKKKARQASGSCVGIPQLLPGGAVKIKNGDSKLIDGTYDIIETKHTFGNDGYKTTFEVGGWKL